MNPYGPYPDYMNRWWPPVARQEGVTITTVANGWIVTAVTRQEPEAHEHVMDGNTYDCDEEDCAYPDWRPFREEQRVFQFYQKEDMLGFVAEATPGRREGE